MPVQWVLHNTGLLICILTINTLCGFEAVKPARERVGDTYAVVDSSSRKLLKDDVACRGGIVGHFGLDHQERSSSRNLSSSNLHF